MALAWRGVPMAAFDDSDDLRKVGIVEPKGNLDRQIIIG
jgi:hypothetical protein